MGMKPFEGKSIEEIGIMVFGKSCKLNKEEKENILEMFEIDQDITETQIIMEDNVNRARYFAEQRVRMKNIFNMMSILNYSQQYQGNKNGYGIDTVIVRK